MIKVAGVWELGWQAPINEVELWKHPINEFGVGNLIMTPVSGIYAGCAQTFVCECPQIEDVITNARKDGFTVVFIDEKATDDLKTFIHPENVMYVFGRTTQSPYTAFYNEGLGDKAIKIQTPANQGGFWAHQAASIVLYDRFLKV